MLKTVLGTRIQASQFYTQEVIFYLVVLGLDLDQIIRIPNTA
jgi:hypothetical protein